MTDKNLKKSNLSSPYAPWLDTALFFFFATVLAVSRYGRSTLGMIFCCILSAAVADLLSAFVFRFFYHAKQLPLDLLPSALSGWATALMMSSNIKFYLPMIFIFLSILLVRIGYPILTKKRNFTSSDGLSPAILATTLLSLFFHREVFTYATPISNGAHQISEDGGSLLSLLHQGSDSLAYINPLNILTGNLASPIGTGSFLLMLAALIFLLLRRPKESILPISYLSGLSILALLFHRAGNPGFSLFLELSGGFAFFLAVAVLSNKRFQTKNPFINIALGLLMGGFTLLFRMLGFPQEGAILAVFFGNLILAALNRLLFKKKNF